jgi:glycosyltransferase involved in cell wall biosynthesis
VHRGLQPILDPLFTSGAIAVEHPTLYHGIEFGLPVWSRVPVVVTVHDLIPFVMPELYPWAWRYRALVLYLLHRVTRVIAVSRSTANDVMRLARVDDDRIDIIGEGVADHFRPRPPERAIAVRQRHAGGRPFLLAVGTFEARKRPAVLADVSRRVREKHDVHLVIAGDQSIFLPAVRAALAESGVLQWTTITGHVPEDELAALYSAAECLVFTSAYEGFGLPPLEAMACGTPCVMFDNSSLPEVGQHGALLVHDGDAAAMADAIVGLLDERDERRRLSEEGRSWAARFTWRETAGRTLEVYRSLVSDRPGVESP